MNDRTEQIDTILRKAHVFSLNPSERKLAAKRLSDRGIKPSQVAAVWVETQRSSWNDESARGLFAAVCREPVRFLEVVEDLEKVEARRGEPTSGMEWVTEDNPFGWSHPELHKRNDHSRPGDWNAFRQSFNLTTEHARRLNRTDVQRKGCSRFEVVGPGDFEKVKRIRAGKGQPGEEIKDASPDWDPIAVELAQQARLAASAEPNSNTRKVYGE